MDGQEDRSGVQTQEQQGRLGRGRGRGQDGDGGHAPRPVPKIELCQVSEKFLSSPLGHAPLPEERRPLLPGHQLLQLLAVAVPLAVLHLARHLKALLLVPQAATLLPVHPLVAKLPLLLLPARQQVIQSPQLGGGEDQLDALPDDTDQDQHQGEADGCLGVALDEVEAAQRQHLEIGWRMARVGRSEATCRRVKRWIRGRRTYLRKM